jgi:arginyl-tRNA synthetase
MLKDTVKDLLDRKVAEVNEGASCVFTKASKTPMIVQKSDGGFGYDATDMAAINYRVNTIGADKICYVTDISQELHFKMLFAAAQ